MNKIAIIILATLVIAGISYQAKRNYDAQHSSGMSDAKSTGPGATQNAANPAAGVTDSSNGMGVAATGNKSSQGHGVEETGNNGKSDAAATNTHPVNQAGSAQSSNPTQGSTATTSTAGKSTSHDTANTNTNTAGSAQNGTVSGTAHTGTSTTSEKVVKTAPEKLKDNCFAFEFRHKKEAANQDIENFLDHTNAFPIVHNDYNPKSMCVKVNQKPVTYQLSKYKQTPEVRVGSMVGPESVIRVSYCVGKVSPCHEKCDQPKKRFMDDLMSDASDDDSFNDSWGKGDAEKAKKDLKIKAKELRTIASENDHLNEASIQREWDELQKQEWVCK